MNFKRPGTLPSTETTMAWTHLFQVSLWDLCSSTFVQITWRRMGRYIEQLCGLDGRAGSFFREQIGTSSCRDILGPYNQLWLNPVCLLYIGPRRGRLPQYYYQVMYNLVILVSTPSVYCQFRYSVPGIFVLGIYIVVILTWHWANGH